MTREETLELHRQGRLEEAEQGYRELLAANPNDGEALRLLGVVRRARGDLEEAATLIRRAHELAPEQPRLLLMLGAIQFQLGNIERSRTAYEQALALDPNSAGAHSTLGHIAMLNADPTLAEQYFRTALRVEEDAQAYAGLGMIALDREDIDTAMKYLSRAADLSPNDASVAFALGRGFVKRGMIAFAEQSFRRALELQPGQAHASNALGQLLLREHRAAEAEPFMRSLLNRRNFELAGELGLGDVYRALGRHEDAVAQYRRALERAPHHEAGFEALLWCLRQLGRAREALALLDERIERFPLQTRWRAERAMLNTQLGRDVEAVDEWQVLHDRDPSNDQVVLELARQRERMGDFDAANELAERLAVRYPDEQEATLIRARARLRSGNDEAAKALLDLIAGRTTRDDVARHSLNLLGRLHDRAGRYDEAVKHFRASQHGLTGMLPRLETLPDASEYARVIAQAQGEKWAHAPILLVGTPGSGVERIAALLGDQPQLSALLDRAEGVRNDGFDTRAFDHTRSELSEENVRALREEYLEPLRRMEIDLDKPIIDWIPRWDARHLVFAQRLMPGTRVVVVDRDIRDAFLNWLAFGWLPYAGLNDFDAAVDWLPRAFAHVRYVVAHGGLPHLVVDADTVMADVDGAPARELAAFVGVERLVRGDFVKRTDTGLGGLPTRFANGHWQVYAQALAEPFERLLKDPYANA
ncbi:MAG TPA: tetratricopeptide repeat protein [Dokdonella sp.]|uniref:tetratricopeptide repeat protein n=1 Tax=Dokdonella sp. TaxID=2291710 RepID=UPI0025BD8A20|nr:tetratricopeptide repeat protein [Dokdonella sp.]MBX3691404.1 tetratricopeptide repeat protein [Dokdonella sp.]MCW5568456.1 tetratricopeptide repeat protein [Dokdonella sp.]HNR91971.1 tetratricopeptide repeat protein [Dokdonella sp.]